MTCLYCQKEFTPLANSKGIFCSSHCVALYNARKMIKFSQLQDKDWLYEQYWVKKKSMRDIARSIGCAETRVYLKMDEFGITRRSISEANLGKEKSEKHIKKIREMAKNRWRGINNPNWRGGIWRKSLEPRFHADYFAWKQSVKRKYKNECAKCKRRLGTICKCCGQIIFSYTHHIKSVKDYPELTLDMNNGILLCYQCHRGEHKIAPKIG